jgi:deazaflavin-dependent oxidoreductase (nitroreductase family)
MPEAMYKKPDWFTQNVMNRLIKWMNRVGIRPAGAQTLAVRGRKSGQMRTNPVNPFELDGRTYLLAPRGTTEWVRNLRAAGGEAELRSGRKTQRFHASELDDADKLPMLRLYMDKWAWEVKSFLEIDPKAPDEELRRIAPNHPIFQISFEE